MRFTLRNILCEQLKGTKKMTIWPILAMGWRIEDIEIEKQRKGGAH